MRVETIFEFSLLLDKMAANPEKITKFNRLFDPQNYHPIISIVYDGMEFIMSVGFLGTSASSILLDKEKFDIVNKRLEELSPLLRTEEDVKKYNERMMYKL